MYLAVQRNPYAQQVGDAKKKPKRPRKNKTQKKATEKKKQKTEKNKKGKISEDGSGFIPSTSASTNKKSHSSSSELELLSSSDDSFDGLMLSEDSYGDTIGDAGPIIRNKGMTYLKKLADGRKVYGFSERDHDKQRANNRSLYDKNGKWLGHHNRKKNTLKTYTDK